MQRLFPARAASVVGFALARIGLCAAAITLADRPAMRAATLQQPIPPLPTLALDSFPDAAREAIAEAHRAAAAAPDDAAKAGRLGMTLHAWEQWDAARAAYARAQALSPVAFDWPYLDAIVAMRMGRAAEAADRLTRALTIVPTSLPARLKLAEALLDAGDLARSREHYLTLVKEPPAEPAAEYGLGRIAGARGDWAEAAGHYERAAKLFPEYGAAHYALALAFRNLGRKDDAQRELTLHQQYGPRWPGIDDPGLARVDALKDDARAQLSRGLALAADGRVKEAIAAHESALRRDPALAQAHANLIALYGRAGNWSKAEEHYRAVLPLKSNLDEAHYQYGVVLGLQQRDTDAAAAFRQAIAISPLHAQAHANLGTLLERERRWADAAAEYRLAVESQPSFRLARFNLGRMLIALGRNDDAVSELERMLATEDKDSPRVVYALATAHFRAGRRERGLEYAREARRLAVAYDQARLVQAIDKDMAAIAAAPRQP